MTCTTSPRSELRPISDDCRRRAGHDAFPHGQTPGFPRLRIEGATPAGFFQLILRHSFGSAECVASASSFPRIAAAWWSSECGGISGEWACWAELMHTSRWACIYSCASRAWMWYVVRGLFLTLTPFFAARGTYSYLGTLRQVGSLTPETSPASLSPSCLAANSHQGLAENAVWNRRA